MYCAARERAKLRLEQNGRAQRQSDPPNAEERIALAAHRHAFDGLVATSVQGPYGDGTPLSPGNDAAIGFVLRLLVRGPTSSVKHQFRAHEANAVANRGIDPFEFLGAGGVEVHRDRGAVLRYRGALTEGCGCSGCGLCAAGP